MSRRCTLCLALALVFRAAPALALSITLAGPTSGVLTSGVGFEPGLAGDTLDFTIGLDAPTSINGYDLSIRWDPNELSVLSASELSGLGFDVAQFTAPTGERVAAIELTAVQASALFRVTFLVLAGAAFDGSADIAVFVNPAVNGGGIAPGSLSLTNPAGAGIDVPESRALWMLAAGLVALGLGFPSPRRRP